MSHYGNQYAVIAHDQGCVDFVDSFGTRAEAQAYIKRLTAEIEAHPSQWDCVAPWFEIEKGYQPCWPSYEFPDMSGHG